MTRRGSVYCMANDEMPRVVKIGATLRCPEDRLNDARSTTWAPTCYRIIAQALAALVEDAFAAEQALHALLAHRRLEARREFFRVTHAEARALFAAVQLTAGPESEAGQTSEADEPDETDDEPDETDKPNRAQVGRLQRLAPTGESAQARLHAWVESKYTHVPLREKSSGTKLEALFGAYTSANPPVHQKSLGKIKFAQLLSAVYPGIGPHRNSDNTVSGIYLLR